ISGVPARYSGKDPAIEKLELFSLTLISQPIVGIVYEMNLMNWYTMDTDKETVDKAKVENLPESLDETNDVHMDKEKEVKANSEQVEDRETVIEMKETKSANLLESPIKDESVMEFEEDEEFRHDGCSAHEVESVLKAKRKEKGSNSARNTVDKSRYDKEKGKEIRARNHEKDHVTHISISIQKEKLDQVETKNED
ncbi:19377_t:CDS:2, partial [Gigaspora margarita]